MDQVAAQDRARALRPRPQVCVASRRVRSS
jgi:hypothetical protein